MRCRTTVEPVLGTRLGLLIDAVSDDASRSATEAILAEGERLESILTIHRPESPFARWRRGEEDCPPAEVIEVLSLAQDWFRRTDGAFNPCLGAVMRRWRQAELEQRVPDRAELLDLARRAQTLPYEVRGRCVLTTGDCTNVDVHGIAKGWVVDRLVDVAISAPGVTSLMVDLGGDIRIARFDEEPVLIGIEDPFAALDNAPPAVIVQMRCGAIATSGGQRRGWSIGRRWCGHLIDPQTGWPLPGRRSCSVIAESAARADAAASAFAVLEGAPANLLADREDLAVFRISDHGDIWRSAKWVTTVDERLVDRDPQHHEGDG